MTVVSRNYVLSSKNKYPTRWNKYMTKLNKRKVRWIIKHSREGMSVYYISKVQEITPRHTRRIIKHYSESKLYKIGEECKRPPGRTLQNIDEKERLLVLNRFENDPNCATVMEKIIEVEEGMHIPHNRIHRILAEAGKVEFVDKKIRRKKWVRYERRHSNSLWHTDFCEIDGKHVIAYIDDASRLITGYGIFDNATTDNALLVLKSAMKLYGTPKQIMTDHGAQFCANEEREYRFREELKQMGIEHIMAKVKRPQSNGKIERFFGTLKRLLRHFNYDLDRSITCYNNRYHLSLEMSPIKAFELKKGND
jgi:putative transposase